MAEQFQLVKEQQQQPQTFSLSTFNIQNINKFPLKIEFKHKLQWLMSLDYIKFQSTKKKQSFFQVFISTKNVDYVQKLFWYLLILKLPLIVYKNQIQNRNNKVQSIIQSLKQSLSEAYVKLFLSIPIPKENIANLLTFVNVFFIVKMYNELFKHEQIRLIVNPRFIYDNYHIVIFQTLGLEVSDMYIQDNINRLFHNYFNDIVAQNQKKYRYTTNKKSESKKLQESQNFFKDKMIFPNPSNNQQLSFKKEIEDYLKIKENISKIKSITNNQQKRKETPISNNTKSSFKTKSDSQFKSIHKSLDKKKLEERISKIDEQKKKIELLKKIEQIQKQQMIQPQRLSRFKRDTLSLVKLGPCVSHFLQNKENKLLQVKPKFIHHPQQKVINNQYLKRLITENLVQKKQQIQKVKVKFLDITKPMQGLSFKEIRSYQQISQKQLQKPYRYKNIIEILQRNDLSVKQYDDLFDSKRKKYEFKLPTIDNHQQYRSINKLPKKNTEIVQQAQNEQETIAFDRNKDIDIEEEPSILQEYNEIKYKNQTQMYKAKYQINKY